MAGESTGIPLGRSAPVLIDEHTPVADHDKLRRARIKLRTEVSLEPDVLVGKPVIRGTRLSVVFVRSAATGR